VSILDWVECYTHLVAHKMLKVQQGCGIGGKGGFEMRFDMMDEDDGIKLAL